MNIFPLDLTQNTDELKRLIAEHPDYPIVILVGEYANTGDYGWMYCSMISYEIMEILDSKVPYDDTVCSDRDEFEERLEEFLWDEYGDKLTMTEFQDFLKKEIARYEPYWKKVIAIYADN